MAFGELNISKVISRNAPKYATIIEPFADYGAFALYLKKKKAKTHIINFQDETLFKIMLIIQNMSGLDFNNLKSRDWVGDTVTFDYALGISAVDGLDFFYKWFYMKHFAQRNIDKEAPKVFDTLKTCKNVKNKLFDFKLTKVGLKGVTILNDTFESVFNMGGTDSFHILTPKKPEEVEFIEGKVSGMSTNFFYSKKKKDNIVLLESVKNNENYFNSLITVSTIMAGDNQVITNYKTNLELIEVEALEFGACKL